MPANKTKLQAMREGGKRLSEIKAKLINLAQHESSLEAIDKEAEKLIKKAGGTPSFKLVPNYYWSTCLNVNEGMVHGIPKGETKPGDLLTIDVGLYYQGLHTDTAVTIVIGKPTEDQEQFLNLGKKALRETIKQAIVGKKIKDVSRSIQATIEAGGCNVVRELTGHGVGQELHMPPAIPCFVANSPEMNVKLEEDMTLAIEVMYMQGNWPLVLEKDGWTLKTKDNSSAAIFEETIYLSRGHTEVLTAINAA